MKHRRPGLPGVMRRLASRLVVSALLAPSFLPLGACDRDDSPRARADSASPAGARQAGDLPAGADATSPLARLRDSAAALDARFQQARDSLDRDSRALDSLDRRSADYARRFDAWQDRARAAIALRAARDRVRASLAKLER